MKLSHLVVALAISILFAGRPLLGLGADTHDANLTPLRPMVGQWKVDYKATDPPIQRQYTVTYKWIMGGKFLEATFLDEKGVHDCTEIFGWDAADKVIKIWGFDTGSLYQGPFSFNGNVWKSQFSSVRPSGERKKTDVVITFAKDSFKAIGTDAVATTPAFEAVFKRIKEGD